MNNNTMLQITISVGEYQKLKKDLAKVAIQYGECLLENNCDICKLADDYGCILHRINEDLNELLKVVVL